MYILTQKQSKGSSFRIEYERNRLSKTLTVNSFKYRMIKGGRGDNQKITFDHKGEGVRRGPKCDHAILEQPLTCGTIIELGHFYPEIWILDIFRLFGTLLKEPWSES